MKTLLVILAIFLSIHCFSQHYITASRKQVKRSMEKYLDKHGYQGSVLETDSTLTLVVSDTSVRALQLVAYFDGKKCYKETRKLDCDSCMLKMLQTSVKGAIWKEVDAKTWAQWFPRKLLAVVNGDNSFTVTRQYWSRREFEDLIKN
jgi:hypothetical protein